ncbi:hypothetical protein K491DRAFT_524634 [Lophiostoma macrostomum CBS 122681]|uniref:Uncharacterized protein n=1 Tax=Lophiostoma macrostomum CBS 122681 TaxID=1314788 RepID=A0A6A6T1X9_9PLEO|nr:hypothetical protein K491DRAFT_524634 [Lophiostoma macrostomum CBS 122681]
MTVPAEENVEHALLSYASSTLQTDAKIILGFTSQGGIVTPLLILATDLREALGDRELGHKPFLRVEEDKGKENFDEYLETNRQVRYMGIFGRSGFHFESGCSIYNDLERQLRIPEFLRRVTAELRERACSAGLETSRDLTRCKAACIFDSVATASQRTFLEDYLRPIDIQGCFHQAINYLRLGNPLAGFSSGAILWKDATQVIEVYNQREGDTPLGEVKAEEGSQEWKNVHVSLAGRIPGLTHREAQKVLQPSPTANSGKGDSVLITGEFRVGKRPTEKVRSAVENGFKIVDYKNVPPDV